MPKLLPQLACRAFASALLCVALASPAQASLTVLVGEPFGDFGNKVPSGHTTIYLDRVCADGPTRLRMCRPGEAAGVAIARYRDVAGTDWTASPILQFLYAVDRVEDVMASPTAEALRARRQLYRRTYMAGLIPDGTEDTVAVEDWWGDAGMAYSRRFWGYQVATTRAQDESFVAAMNARPNKSHYKVRGSNCADFAADTVNFYFPGTVHSDRTADFGVMSPKQVARSLYAYGQTHPGSQLRVFEVPQVPGPLVRSKPVRGGAETFLKTPRYVVPIAILQPETIVVLGVLYLPHGRWQVKRDCTAVGPKDFDVRGEAPVAGE